MAYPSLPESRTQFQQDRGNVSSIVLEAPGLSTPMVSQVSPSQSELIDTAMAQLFGGDLALRYGGPVMVGSKSQASLANVLQPTDWRSRDAWSGFLAEARQQASGSDPAHDLNTMRLQLASLSVQPQSAVEPGDNAPGMMARKVGREVAKFVRQPGINSSEAVPQKGQALVRVSASAVEVRAIEMIAPLIPVSDAPEGAGPGEVMSEAGQIVGSVFIDRDGDGQPGRGDTRLEGQAVSLTPLQPDLPRLEHRSASFGQFAFEGVKPGAYLLSVLIGWEEVSVPVEIEQGSWGHRIGIAVPPEIAAPVSIGLASGGGIEAEDSGRKEKARPCKAGLFQNLN